MMKKWGLLLSFLYVSSNVCPAFGDFDFDDRSGDDPDAIKKTQLPFFPVKEQAVILAAGMTFDPVPNARVNLVLKLIPVPIEKDHHTAIDSAPIPEGYDVTDDFLITQKLEGKNHSYEAMIYRTTNNDAFIAYDVKRVFILYYDNTPFCVGIGESGMGVYFGLKMEDKKVMLDVSQDESGTGAFNTHAIFELTQDGPKLTGLTSGGRTR